MLPSRHSMGHMRILGLTPQHTSGTKSAKTIVEKTGSFDDMQATSFLQTSVSHLAHCALCTVVRLCWTKDAYFMVLGPLFGTSQFGSSDFWGICGSFIFTFLTLFSPVFTPLLVLCRWSSNLDNGEY